MKIFFFINEKTNDVLIKNSCGQETLYKGFKSIDESKEFCYNKAQSYLDFGYTRGYTIVK